MDHASLIARLFIKSGLGEIISPVNPVSGGYLHRMYRVETTRGIYAVKILNPEIMSRPGAMENYARAEEIEAILEAHSIPAVTAITVNGRKMQEIDGTFAYIFPWLEGRALPWDGITADHCRITGALLGRIHSISRRHEKIQFPPITADWDVIAAAAEDAAPALSRALSKNLPIIKRTQSEYNRALAFLPHVVTITDGDMDCKNVLWNENGARIIDLECLDYGNPASDMLILAFSWAGGAACNIDPQRLDAFIGAYAEEYGPPEGNLPALYPMGYSWLDWLEYNIRRAACLIPASKSERQTAISESFLTIDRIIHHSRMESELMPILRKWHTGETHT